MKLVTISHSHIALRQQLFFREVAEQGHNVLVIGPGQWGKLRDGDHKVITDKGTMVFRTCRHQGDNIYNYRLLGAKDLTEAFNPDWLYIQAEPGSVLAEEAINWKAKKRAIFTWENIRLNPSLALPKYDLVVCGNPDAVALVQKHNPNTHLALQVGVDTDHFAARPGVPRDVKVGYLGRDVSEKGLPYLAQAWPTVQVLEWKDFRELPWWYSRLQVIVAFSQDVPWWREQAPPYVMLEAMSCQCAGVVSSTAASTYWLGSAPGVIHVEGHSQPDEVIRLDRTLRLRKGIQAALEITEAMRICNRDYVISRFSNKVVAENLLRFFQ